MMKKWFNIKSKKYECDEDRVDTDAERKETEREDKEDRDNDGNYCWSIFSCSIMQF